MNQDVGRVVDAIAGRIREQLQEQARAHISPKQPCKAGKEQCIGCGWSSARRADDTRTIMNSGAARVGAALDVGHVPSDIAKYIDHTLLKADATKEQLTRLCSEAKQFGFATVCVNPGNVRFCSDQLRGSSVKVCAVVGFPLGATTAAAKAFEARDAIRAGAREIDMVINIGALKSGDYDAVYEDIRKVVESSSPYKVKVILETGQLTDREKIVASTLSKLAKAAFVKTSTGFGPGGATVEDILLMKTVVGDKLEVKASGGVRTSEDAQRMIEAGATRIGASASVAIVTGAKGGAKSGY